MGNVTIVQKGMVDRISNGEIGKAYTTAIPCFTLFKNFLESY